MVSAFQFNFGTVKIETKPVPVESPNTMTYVERYHTPLERSYAIIRKELPDISDEEVLQYAIKSLNESVGPDVLVPTLLVYGALPKLGFPSDKPAPDVHPRAIAVRKASDEMLRYFAKRQLSSGLASRNGPGVTDVHKAPLGSKVLVYRTKSKSWEGPFRLLNLDRETVSVQCPDGPKQFRSTVVKFFKENEVPEIGMRIAVYWPKDKKFYTGKISQFDEASGKNKVDYDDEVVEHLNLSQENWRVAHDTQIPTACIAFNTSVEVDGSSERSFIEEIKALIDDSRTIGGTQFEASRRKELLGLLEKGVLEPMKKSEADGHRVFGCRFVDSVKHQGTPEAYAKSRLVEQGFNNKSHGLLTHALTVQRSSLRLLLALTTVFPKRNVIVRDITQAYTQSSTDLHRSVFCEACSRIWIVGRHAAGRAPTSLRSSGSRSSFVQHVA